MESQNYRVAKNGKRHSFSNGLKESKQIEKEGVVELWNTLRK